MSELTQADLSKFCDKMVEWQDKCKALEAEAARLDKALADLGKHILGLSHFSEGGRKLAFEESADKLDALRRELFGEKETG